MSETTTKADIVVGVDGSDESFAALKWALKEASLTGQHVNAVFGWTHSWDMGSEPDSDEAWAKVRHDIANELKSWVEKATVKDIAAEANVTRELVYYYFENKQAVDRKSVV